MFNIVLNNFINESIINEISVNDDYLTYSKFIYSIIGSLDQHSIFFEREK